MRLTILKWKNLLEKVRRSCRVHENDVQNFVQNVQNSNNPTLNRPETTATTAVMELK